MTIKHGFLIHKYLLDPWGGGSLKPSPLRLSFNSTLWVQQMLMHRKICLIPIPVPSLQCHVFNCFTVFCLYKINFIKKFLMITIEISTSLDPDQVRHFVDDTSRQRVNIWGLFHFIKFSLFKCNEVFSPPFISCDYSVSRT